jgi:hypothetical protein
MIYIVEKSTPPTLRVESDKFLFNSPVLVFENDPFFPKISKKFKEFQDAKWPSIVLKIFP